MRFSIFYRTLSILSLTFLVPSNAWAHFPWLVRDSENKAQLFFGEGLSDRTYHLPPSIAKAEINRVDEKGQVAKLSTTAVENEKFVGLTSSETAPADCVLSSSVTYGVFRGSKLHYTALSFGKLAKDAARVTLPGELTLQAKVVDTDKGITVAVTWDGKPLPQVKVDLLGGKSEEVIVAETDSAGLATFTDEQVHEGLNAIRVGHKVSKEGKMDDKPFSGEMHYLTATFSDPETPAVAATEFAPLPFAITSFGAATDGKALYVYGGHMGDAHSYSEEEQSNKLLRMDLSGTKRDWQELATGKRLQGTTMVAHSDELIVIGGFQARNKAGDKKDLNSISDVRSFNTASKSWTELPALPEPRSSHDAAIIGSTVYVVGGWKLAGDDEEVWHKTSWKMDLSSTARTWQPVPNPPFERRAVAALAHEGKLIVVGGMNRDGGPTKAVAAFDPQSQNWSSLPEIIGEKGMAGFGVSGWSIDGRLIVSSHEGDLEELTGNNTWKVIGKTKDARFFHRVLPIGDGKLVAIGGANMGSGKITDTEVIAITDLLR